MEDERTQHPLLHIPPVDTAALPEVIRSTPGLRLELLNRRSNNSRDELKKVLDAGEVYTEIAMLEGVAGVGRFTHEVPIQRILFGSYYPFYDFESALLKIQESGLDEASQKVICQDNARRLLGK
jgi:hypothetical protein